MAFLAIAIELGIEIGLWALNKYVLDDEKKLPEPRPAGLEFSQTSVDTPVPYIAGTIRATPALVWYGNAGASAVAGGKFEYRVDALFAVGTPMWDSADAPWSNWRAASPPNLRTFWYGDAKLPLIIGGIPVFHGQKGQAIIRPNGVVAIEAAAWFYDGRPTQTLAGQRVALKMAASGIDPTNIPGYRHRMLLGLLATPGSVVVIQPNRGSIGNDPHIAAVAVEISSVGPQPIGLDANPAWVLYDLLCRPVWGLGIDPADVDLDSFQAVADTLEAEGHGCSILIQQAEDAVRIIHALQSQVDGVVYESPSTGKIKFRLIRNDYDPDALPVITAAKCIGRPTIDDVHERDCPTEMRVSYTDRSRDYTRDTVPWKNEGGSAARGGQRRPTDFDAPGCMSAGLAAKIAARELSVAGQPLSSIRIKVNREFYALETGDPIKVDLPEYQIDGEIYRVGELDFGQLAAGAIEMRLIRDVFDQTTGASAGDPPPDPVIFLLPATTRVLDEASYFWQQQAVLAGYLASLGTQHLWAFAAPEPSPDPANRFRLDTTSGGPSGNYGGFGITSLPDVGPQNFPTTCTLAVAALRTAEPYDTVTGLVVENVVLETGVNFTDFFFEPTDIANGFGLWLLGGENIVPPAGEGAPYQRGELIAFESVVDLGGGQWQLVNVYRGLLDTAPRDWPIGTRLYHLRLDAIGQRDWTPDPVNGFWIRGTTIPLYKGVVGADGIDATDDVQLNVLGRRLLALRAADLRIRGYDMDGTHGIPSTTQTYPYLGDFKACSRFEGSFDIVGRQNRITAGVVVRGDDDGYTAEAGTTWTVRARKVGEDEGDVLTDPPTVGLGSPTATGMLLGTAGHGEIDVYLDSYGSNGQACWQSPAIRVDAPTWRNLIALDSFDGGVLAPWTALTGTVTLNSGASSLQRYSSSGYWAQPATFVAGETAIRQTIDVSGYKPIGLTAVVSWYCRNFSGDTDDTSKVTIRALDASDVELTSSTSSSIVGPTTHWRRGEHTLVLPAGTAKLRVDITMTAVSTEVVNIGVTRIRLQLGQVSSELLTNGSFDGNLTSWTTVSGGFVVNSTNPYSSRNGTIGAAQGGAFASSEIKQQPSVPAGYEYGVALLQLAHSLTIAGDTAEAVLEVLDGGGAVIATGSAGGDSTFPKHLNTWERLRIAVQLPDGAASLRVRLLATRTGGAGNSGACFDDLSLRIHKDLDPTTTLDFDFRTPVWQPAPTTWQRFHLDFPTLPVPLLVWEGSSEVPSVRPDERLTGPTSGWSDASHPESATFIGLWRLAPSAIYPDPAYRESIPTFAHQFVRATAGSAVDLQLTGADDTTGEEYGAFDLDEDFTIAVLFRTDEITWAGACGLIGRRDNSGHGYGIEIDASGHPKAILQGASSAVSIALGTVVHDRAPHWVFLVNETATGKLWCYQDGINGGSVSTTGIGAITATATPFRVGRDGPASQTGGVQIARELVWRAALSSDDVAAIAQYGRDPTGLLDTAYPDVPVWAPVADHITYSDGAALLRFGTGQVPIGSDVDGFGFVEASGGTNKIPSHDFTASTVWAGEATVTLTQGIVDCTGLPRGVRVTNASANHGLACSTIQLSGGSQVSALFFARTTDGVDRDLVVELRDSDGNLVGSQTVTLGASWSRYHVTLSGWINHTPTGILRFALAPSATGSFDLAHPTWVDFGADAPFAIQDAATMLGGITGSRVAVIPLQGNYEGELYVRGVCSIATPDSDASFIEVDTDSNVEGSRALVTGSAGAPKFEHYDDAAILTSESGSAIDWTQGFELRGRWNRLELPESVGAQVGLVVNESSNDSATYSAAAFAVGASPLNEVFLGGDPNHLAPNAIVSRAIVRFREPKLAG